MDISYAVLATDGVNRMRMLMPLSTLIGAIETQVSRCRETGVEIGLPMNLSHDRCRSIGWCRSNAVLVTKDFGRHLGIVFFPESDEERADVQAAIASFNVADQAERTEPLIADLRARIPTDRHDDLKFVGLDIAGATAPGLAATLYPDFFPGGVFADKDGLADYRALQERFAEKAPGIFHDAARDLVLVAHPYFRRSLSRMNVLNGYALASFARAAESDGVTSARLRLDPDFLGHPDGVQSFIECEYVRGPKFSDDVAAIPSGVTEHQTKTDDRNLEGVSKTQTWWKSPEDRPAPKGEVQQVRTFEVEELIEEPLAGLRDDAFGCRYAHAEFDIASGKISHFDGAIRAYSPDAYLQRIDQAIDRAGKQADYTKLFRLDGALPVPVWKRVLSDFYRGNSLIPEYLGAPPIEEELAELPQSPCYPTNRAEEPALAMLFSFDLPSEAPTPRVPSALPDRVVDFGSGPVPVAEARPGPLNDLVREWIDTSKVGTVCLQGDILNLATIDLGETGLDETWTETHRKVTDALRNEVAGGELLRASVAFQWTTEEIKTTWSISGQAALVAELLAAAGEVVTPSRPVKSWADSLRDRFHAIAPDLAAPVDWPRRALWDGRLSLSRPARATGLFLLPEAQMTAEKARCAAAEAT